MKNAEQPAYPTNVLDQKRSMADQGLVVYDTIGGLTKREYFAGLAMQGMIQSHKLNLSKEEASVIAGQSIQFADELLKQLNQ